MFALSAGSILMVIPTAVFATSLTGFAPPSEVAANSPKDVTVKKYVADCVMKAGKDPSCEKLRKEAIDILKEDVLTLGSSANRDFLPTLLKVFKSDAPELRIAVLDAIGMIGPTDSDALTLARIANDPVPDVRKAFSQTISRGKGNALSLLGQRFTLPQKSGLTPEVPPDAGRFGMPVAPDSVYLFDSGDATKGRLSYVARAKSDPTQFYKSKAKKGPFKWEQFKEQYRYQLQDEEEALDQTAQAAGKQLESEKPPDLTNMEAFTAYMQRMQSVSTQGSMGRAGWDMYQPNLYGAPTVYVLEERQIGKRSYPTKFVVLYQEQALRKPGYRLSWMTVSDSAIKAAQAKSLAEEQEERANQAENEALKKKEAELDALTKKKNAAEKRQFKKGQEDLEKALGF
jgi:hypothetical protein